MAASPVTAARLRFRGVAVLLYHRIVPDPFCGADKYCVPASAFQRQLEYLRQQGCGTGKVCDLRDGSGVAQPDCILSFDDGYDSDYRLAFPLLSETGRTATFFVNTAHAGQPGYLSWREMREMQQTGMSFQSHGHQHVDLSRLTLPAMVEELGHSRELLEQNLGRKVECFAAPYGLVNRRLVQAAEKAGFRTICTSRNRLAQPGQQTVGRIAIYGNAGQDQFEALATGDARQLLRRAIREAALEIPKRLMLRICPQRLGVRLLEDLA